MKALTTSLFLACVSFLSQAQKSPAKFGDIPMEDLKMNVYAPDSSAEAVILFDYGHADIDIDNVRMNFERHVRIKILKKEGLDWANAYVSLYHSKSSDERVVGLKASTYTLENGKMVETKMDKGATFKEKFNRNVDHLKFTLPNVKEGAVIEYAYTVMSEFFVNFPNWQFQRKIPARLSEYWAVIPDYFDYERYMQGYLQASYETKPLGRGTAHHWTIKNVPAFREEPYMTCEDDYVSKINFSLSHISIPGQYTQEVMGSWEKLNALLLEDEEFTKTVTGNNFLKKTVDELTAGVTDSLKKIAAIHAYVKQNVEWDGVSDYYAVNPKKVLEFKKGSSGDINLLLGSMLDKAGFNVDMVLLSTRDHGFIRIQSPMAKQFNYTVCLVKVNGKNLLLDATEKFLPMNAIPQRCLNGEGLVISRTNHGWINLETKTRSRTLVDATLALDAEGDLKGKIGFMRDGYDAHTARKNYRSKGEKTYLADFQGNRSWEMEKSDFQNMDDPDKQAKESHDVVIHEQASVAGDVIYVNPFVTGQLTANPFIAETRIYPVDFGSLSEKMYFCKITLPEGFVVDEMPKSKILVLPENAAKYMYNLTQTGNVLTLTSSLQVNRSIFLQEEYPNLREFYAQVISKQAEQIVLKKK